MLIDGYHRKKNLYKMSCLFRSISHFFPNMSATKLRAMVCDQLESEPNIFGDGSFMVEEQYVQQMRKPMTFGGGIEISTCCNLLSVNIRVINKRDHTRDIIFRPKREAIRTICIEWTGNHYEPKR